ncbi:hypothetical protein IPM62_01360 [Candidatus Woesebacteria bacterium]|nr:MAG: hypothetical protein IPM62_01360 [Candidatus Woesebacteria bacterium]
MKLTTIIFVALVLVCLGIITWRLQENRNTNKINSYEECVKASNGQVNLMYPPQCTTKDGRTFIDPSAKPLNSVGNLDEKISKDIAQGLLFADFPEISKGLAGGPPAHMLYYFENNEGWQVVYTTEGSGVDQIFEASCFKVTHQRVVYQTGNYKYENLSSYILKDIDNLDTETCRVKGW